MDREKVISNLQGVNEYLRHFENTAKMGEWVADALALLKEQEDTIKELQNAYDYLQKQFFEAQDKLLKEQEAVKPEKEHSGSGITWWNVCGNCKTAINPNDKYCHECGTPVLWEGR